MHLFIIRLKQNKITHVHTAIESVVCIQYMLKLFDVNTLTARTHTYSLKNDTTSMLSVLPSTQESGTIPESFQGYYIQVWAL